MSNYTDLDTVNDDIAVTLLPVIVLVFIYMVIGLIGNPLVAYYYGWYVKPSTSYYFVTAMAMFDLIICGISMPLEIVDMRYTYQFPSKDACKIFRFVNYFASISSGSILVAIAADRYKKVCQPFKKQIATRMSKIIIGIVCLSAFSVSWPAFVLFDITSVNVTSSPGLIGYDCTTIRNEDFKIHITLFNGVCFLIFIGCFTTLITVYSLIGKKLIELNKFRFSVTTTRKSKNISHSPPTSSIEMELRSKGVDPASNSLKTIKTTDCRDSQKEVKSQAKAISGSDHNSENKKQSFRPITETHEKFPSHGIHSKIQTSEMSDYSDSNTDVKASTSVEKQSRNHQQKKSYSQFMHLKKYTILMLSITVAFVVSFLPYLSLITWRTFVPYEGNILSSSALVLYNLFLRSWLLSSVLNPLIYGLFNSDFRFFVSRIFRRICCCVTDVYDMKGRNTSSKQNSS